MTCITYLGTEKERLKYFDRLMLPPALVSNTCLITQISVSHSLYTVTYHCVIFQFPILLGKTPIKLPLKNWLYNVYYTTRSMRGRLVHVHVHGEAL